MLISDKFKNEFSEYLKTYLPSAIAENKNFNNGTEAIFEDLIPLSTEKICLARKRQMKLECDQADLAERVLKVSNGLEIIAGARFKNLDIKFPFVEIHKTKTLDPQDFKNLQSKIPNEFKSLKPLGFKFKDKPGLNFEKWSHVVFGANKPMKIENQLPDLKLSFSKKLDWYDQYVEEYQERLKEKKELAGFVRIGELDEFEDAIVNDSLLIVEDSKGFAGVIAGINSPLYGLNAIYMIESYLSKRFVGKKLAPLVHKYFLNKLSARFPFVWGTVYDKNLSSLRTAERTGRTIIETEYFIKF